MFNNNIYLYIYMFMLMFQNNMGGTLDSICDEIRRQFSSDVSDPIVEYCVAVKLESGSVMTLGSSKL